MASLKILLTNSWLKGRSGTEIVTMEMARGLKRRGHEVVIFSPDLGKSAEALRREGTCVTDRLDDLDFKPDVIHGNQHTELVYALIAYPRTPGIFVCHDANHLPERLKHADIVFATARMAIEAMAVGCAVVIVDGRGLAGLVTPDVVAAWREENFGRAILTRPVSVELLTQEIARYDAAGATRVAADVRRNHDLGRSLSIYEAIYRVAIAKNPTIDPEIDARELSRLVRPWLPVIEGE